MPKLVHRTPKYCRHRASGQAIVTINGQDIYLGPYGTAVSRREYDRVIGEWLANGRRHPYAAAADLSVVELIAAYWRHAKSYYASSDNGDGDSNGELSCLRLALGVLKRLYADTAVGDFGPLALKSVRQEMVKIGWSRSHINPQVGRVRRMFKWGVENEMVPPSVLHGLQAVSGLRRGKTEAREREPVKPVAEASVEAVRDHVARQVWAMIQLQLLSGMRPGEVRLIRTGDVDSSGRLWVYRPKRHKTQNNGHQRTIYLGPKAQEVLRPFLRRNPDEYVFSPAQAEAERRAKLAAARKTPLSCGNRAGTNQRRRPGRAPGDRYTATAYLRAIYAGCDAAFPPPPELARQRVPANGRNAMKSTRWETAADWKARVGDARWERLRQWQREHRWHPHQLRHNAATRLRRDFGLEAAQVILGHKTLSVTEIYAAKNVAAAERIMAEAG